MIHISTLLINTMILIFPQMTHIGMIIFQISPLRKQKTIDEIMFSAIIHSSLLPLPKCQFLVGYHLFFLNIRFLDSHDQKFRSR